MARVPNNDSAPKCKHPNLNRRLRGLSTDMLLAQCVSFLLPVANVIFLASGPHRWDVAITWTLPVWLCIYADLKSPPCRRDLGARTVAWPFVVSLYALFALQIANIAFLLQLAASLQWSSPQEFGAAAANIAAMRIMTGTNSCCSGIAVAHELIHRRLAHQRWMGRILLWTVCYDHFLVEHLLGHHRRASTPEDPATARFGESFRSFWRRTWKEQFISAWSLENRRLAARHTAGRILWHRVIHGLLIQASLLLLITAQFGVVAMLMFLYQAFVAVRLLEAVNYFQHWGLTRTDRRFSAADAWVTDSG